MTTSINTIPAAFQVALPQSATNGGSLEQAETRGAALQNRPKNDTKLRDAFNDFVGQTFYGQLLSAMRSTVDKPAYFHGGRAEEAFQAQLDQVLAEKMADASAEQFTGPMFDLFSMSRR
jgi:flagellar protein FlgJ